MATGYKTGGRQAGTPNKRTQGVIERLEALGCDPIEGMARIAMDKDAPLELRGRMYSELAQYVACKRKAVEVTQPDDKIIFKLNIGGNRGSSVHEMGPLSGEYPEDDGASQDRKSVV